jgi:hypothetical protein
MKRGLFRRPDTTSPGANEPVWPEKLLQTPLMTVVDDAPTIRLTGKLITCGLAPRIENTTRGDGYAPGDNPAAEAVTFWRGPGDDGSRT